MVTENQIVNWYAGSKEFIIEGNMKYCLPVLMGIQLRKYIRRFQKNGERNLVMEWYNLLEVHERAQIEVTALN